MGSVFSSSTAAATSSQQQPTTANNSNNNGSTSEFSSVPPRRDSGCRQRQSREAADGPADVATGRGPRCRLPDLRLGASGSQIHLRRPDRRILRGPRSPMPSLALVSAYRSDVQLPVPQPDHFNQNNRVCDWWYNVKCDQSAS